MKLYVMRHGPAEDHTASGHDFDRALTPAGRDRVRSVAKELLDEDESPLLIVTSPLVRSVQTAEIVAVATKLSERGGKVETRRELAPGGDLPPYVDGIVASTAKRVMFVGHEPDLSAIVSYLLKDRMPVPMDKGMVVGLHAGPDHAIRLRFILDPKKLTWEHDARKA